MNAVLTVPSFAPATVARPLSSAGLLRAAGEGNLTPEDVMGCLVGGGVASLAVSATGLNVLAHEAGHAVSVSALFENANPTISITPMKGGVTSWNPSGGLSELGESIGLGGSRAIVSGAGAIVDTAIAMTTFAAGYKLRKSHPILGRTLMGYAGMTMLNDILYAGTALVGNAAALAAKGNDFASLAVHAGIPPIAAIAIMAAVLPAEYLLLRALERARTP
ncbi:MAG: hypothetical protein FJX76_12780 [Armatimonadetes bacterium]|nr:hypothetical protein [Armatimonadota bacterium]